MKWFLKENIIDNSDDEQNKSNLYRQNDIGRKLSSRKSTGIPKGMTVLSPDKVLGNTEQELYDNKNEIIRNLNLAIATELDKTININYGRDKILTFNFTLNVQMNFDYIFKNNLEQLFLNLLYNHISDYIKSFNHAMNDKLLKCEININFGKRLLESLGIGKFINSINNNFNFNKLEKELDLKMEEYNFINFQETKIFKNRVNYYYGMSLHCSKMEITYIKKDELEKLMQQDYRPNDSVPEDYYTL